MNNKFFLLTMLLTMSSLLQGTWYTPIAQGLDIDMLNLSDIPADDCTTRGVFISMQCSLASCAVAITANKAACYFQHINAPNCYNAAVCIFFLSGCTCILSSWVGIALMNLGYPMLEHFLELPFQAS